MRPTALLRAASCAVALAGCAHRPPPPLHAAHLEIYDSGGVFRAFVRARVAGQALWLHVDTGAFENVLPEPFARARRLKTRSPAFDEYLVDANGTVTVVASVSDVPVQFEGEAAAGALDFVVNPSPQMEHGVVTPQALVRPGWAVVLDFARAELRYEREDEAVRRLGGDGALRKVEFRSCGQEGLFNRKHRYAAATVRGSRVEMMLDTGADRTTLARNNPAVRSLLQMEGALEVVHGMTSQGKGVLVKDVAVELAGAAFVVTALVSPQSDLCSGGEIGMDLLRHCAIVWAWDALWLGCHPPPAAPAR